MISHTKVESRFILRVLKRVEREREDQEAGFRKVFSSRGRFEFQTGAKFAKNFMK